MDQPKRTLSEISHLFLSEVRDRQHGSLPRPTRVGPKTRPDFSIDMTPEEYAVAFEQNAAGASDPAETAPQIAVVVASHLVDRHSDRVREYARDLSGEIGRLGLIEVDSRELKITCFDPDPAKPADPILADGLDGRIISEVLGELAFDVSHWIISLPDPKSPEAREILRRAPHWVLMTTPDHDGVVSTYRALKGFAELGRPRVSLVALDVRNEQEADAVFRKLDGVSRQFLGCHIEPEAPLRPCTEVAEHMVLHCKSANDAGQGASSAQWAILMEFLAGAKALDVRDHLGASKLINSEPSRGATVAAAIETNPMNITSTIQEAPQPGSDVAAQVIDLPPGESDHGSILLAVVREGGVNGDWVECPIKAPMCPEAVLAVSRDHRLMLLAVAGRGLTELRAIGLAFRWMAENRALIRMALPQLSIDALAEPMVRLLVDFADLSADLLQPLLQSSTVSVQAYRKLKWGSKTGLLLEAA